MSRFIIVVMVLFFVAGVNAAEKWSLLPIKGNQPNKWDAGDNWIHAKGNPLKVDGGEWLLAIQDKPEPAVEDEYTPMQGGMYVNYYYVWKGGEEKEKDPRLCYRGTTLKSRPQAAGIHNSRASAIIFTPDAAGKYRVEINGRAQVQNHTAGCALVTFGVLSGDGKTFTVKNTTKLNSDKPGAYNKLPTEYKVDEVLELKQGDKIVLRLQTNSPGKASAGSSSLILKYFTVTQE